MAGVPLKTVQELMGHKTIQTTARYAHLSPGHLQNAVELLSGAKQPPNSPRAAYEVNSHQNSQRTKNGQSLG